MKCFLVLTVLASLLPAGPLRAQDPDKTYDLKLKAQPAVGQKTDLSHTESQKMKMVMKAGDQVLNNLNQAEERSFAAREEVLKVDGDKATLLKWQFSKAVKTAGENAGPLGFQGKTVLVKKVENHDTEYTYESGDKLEGEDLESIKKAFHGNEDKKGPSGEELFAPKKPVKVGESWSPPLDVIVKGMFDGDMAEAIDLKTSKCVFTLKSVSSRKGALFGKIEGVLDLSLSQMGPMKLDAPIRMKINGDMDVCIDGKIPDGEMKLAMVMKGLTTSDGPNGVKFSIDMDMSVNSVANKKSAP